MTCSIEMLPCDECGQEVQRYYIYVQKDEEGQTQYVCAECVEGKKAQVEAESSC